MNTRNRYCILTNDVETTSIANHCLSAAAGDLVLKEGMPLLLELYGKYDIKATFFFNGDIVRQHPEVVKMIVKDGHEVASHGWVHEPAEAFDVLTREEQIKHLLLSKELLETVSNKKVISFRAPALRINEHTAEALTATGFLVDSSISPQRMDMFLSFGVIKKMKWLFAPRFPYVTNETKLWKKGNGRIFEIPISAFVLAYIGTTLRIMPFLTRLTRYLLHWEAGITNKPIVFLTHPNEFINEKIEVQSTQRRSKNIFSYILGDVIRRRLKLKNLGSKALPLYEREIQFFKKKGYKFVTCEEYFLLNQKN